MKTLQSLASGVFIACLVVLTIVSILGIWDVLDDDVIWKSFQTIGLLAVVAVIIILAGKFIGSPSAQVQMMPTPPSPAFQMIRNITLIVLIISASLLALLGVLAIWDVISDKATVGKSLSSLGVLAFSSLVIVMVCLEREQNDLWKKRSGQLSGGAVLAAMLLAWLLIATSGWR